MLSPIMDRSFPGWAPCWISQPLQLEQAINHDRQQIVTLCVLISRIFLVLFYAISYLINVFCCISFLTPAVRVLFQPTVCYCFATQYELAVDRIENCTQSIKSRVEYLQSYRVGPQQPGICRSYRIESTSRGTEATLQQLFNSQCEVLASLARIVLQLTQSIVRLRSTMSGINGALRESAVGFHSHVPLAKQVHNPTLGPMTTSTYPLPLQHFNHNFNLALLLFTIFHYHNFLFIIIL